MTTTSLSYIVTVYLSLWIQAEIEEKEKTRQQISSS
jgi:hypothetical protein